MSTTTSATLRWTGDTVFAATSDDGSVLRIDLPIDKGGAGVGFSPMALLLHALGTCLATTLAQILAKQRLRLDAYEVVLDGERADTRPSRYTRIVVEHRLRGEGLSRANVERLVALVEERYCAVAATLQHGLVEQRVVIVDGYSTVPSSSPSASK